MLNTIQTKVLHYNNNIRQFCKSFNYIQRCKYMVFVAHIGECFLCFFKLNCNLSVLFDYEMRRGRSARWCWHYWVICGSEGGQRRW